MESIRMIAMSICVTAVITAIFSMLVPNTNFDKILKFAISLFFLTGLISPFFTNKLSFYFDVDKVNSSVENQHLNDIVQNQFISLTQQKLAAGIEKALILEGISPKKVIVCVNITDDNGISINKLIIVVSKEDTDKISAIKKIVKKEIDFDPEIYSESKEVQNDEAKITT